MIKLVNLPDKFQLNNQKNQTKGEIADETRF